MIPLYRIKTDTLFTLLLFFFVLIFLKDVLAQQLIGDFTGSVKPGGQAVREFTLDLCNKITVRTSQSGGKNNGPDLSIMLVDPKGNKIDFYKPGGYPGAQAVSYPRNARSMKSFHPGQCLSIEQPATGKWKIMVASPASQQGDQNYSINISVDEPGYIMETSIKSETALQSKIFLLVTLKNNGLPVKGADVRAQCIIDRQKTTVNVKLSDNGRKADSAKNDGVYTALIPPAETDRISCNVRATHNNFERQGKVEFKAP